MMFFKKIHFKPANEKRSVIFLNFAKTIRMNGVISPFSFLLLLLQMSVMLDTASANVPVQHDTTARSIEKTIAEDLRPIHDSIEQALANGNCNLATALSDTLFTRASNTGDESEVIRALFLKGRAWACHKKWKPAESIFLTALSRAEKSTHPELEWEALTLLSTHAASFGKYKEALQYQKTASARRDSVIAIRMAQQISSIQILKSNEERRENAIIENQKILEQQQQANQKNVLHLLYLSTFLLLLFLTILIIYFIQRKKWKSRYSAIRNSEKFNETQAEKRYVEEKLRSEKLRFLVSYQRQLLEREKDEHFISFDRFLTEAKDHLNQLIKSGGEQLATASLLNFKNAITKTHVALKADAAQRHALGNPAAILPDILRAFCEAHSTPDRSILLKCTGAYFPLSEKRDQIIIQMAGELIPYMMHYSAGHTVWVVLHYTSDALSLTIKGDGKKAEIHPSIDSTGALEVVSGWLAWLEVNSNFIFDGAEGISFEIHVPAVNQKYFFPIKK